MTVHYVPGSLLGGVVEIRYYGIFKGTAVAVPFLYLENHGIVVGLNKR